MISVNGSLFKRFILLVSILFVAIAANATEGKTAKDEFPLGKVPAGWSFAPLTDFVRKLEDLPSEVIGTLDRNLSSEKKVSIYVVLRPVDKGNRKPSASLWSWIDQVFVPAGINKPRSYELNLQKNVGPQKQWTYREAKVMRAGIPMNLTAFYAQNKYHHIYLVLREDTPDYQIQVTQLKDLITELSIN